MPKISTHRPPHLFLDETHYFITICTLNKNPFFDTDQKKNLILQALINSCATYKYRLIAWVILNNHFHFLLKVGDSEDLSKFIRSIQGKSAIELNKLLKTPGVKRWYQYWDKCIDDEKGFWMRFNYIHQNPVKHSYAKNMEDYKFSSYSQYLSKYGQAWLSSCFEEYPIVDYVALQDDF